MSNQNPNQNTHTLSISIEPIPIQIISDLHFEFRTSETDRNNNIYVEPKAEYLCIAGDFCPMKLTQYYKDRLKQIVKKFRRTFIVSGNHEYYGSNIETVDAQMKSMCSDINAELKFSVKTDNENEIRDQKKYASCEIHFLQRSSYDIDSTWRICGATLWTRVKKEQFNDAFRMLNDYKQIDSFTPEITNQIHQLDREFLAKEISNAKKDNKQLIILTHHQPTFKMIASKFQFYPGNFLFASDCEDLMEGDANQTIRAWICGHSHYTKQITINDIVVICNPLGYPKENTCFSRDKCVQLIPYKSM